MVFNVIQNILDPNNLHFDFQKREKALVSEGFSPAEAKEVAWIQSTRTNGKYYGLVFGAFTVYTCNRGLNKFAINYFPRIGLSQSYNALFKIGVVYAHYLLFDYLWTSNRYASNNKYTNHTILSNRLYQDSREAFVNNFEPLNRKFTSEEVQQFVVRDDLITSKKGERNWIYNPHVHGEDEEAWRQSTSFLYEQNKSAVDDLRILKKIKEENQEKIYNGEDIQYKPFKTTEFIDKSGLKHGLAQFWLFNRWQPI